MMNAAVILIVCGLTVAHSATLKYEVNALDSKGDQKNFDLQSTISSIMESTTGNTHPENFAPLRIKSGKEEKTIMSEKKMPMSPFQEDRSPAFPQHPGLKTEQKLFQSGHPVASLPRSSGFDNFNGQQIFPVNDQFYSGERGQQNQDQMFDNRQNIYEQQSYYGDDQNAPGQYFGNQGLPQQGPNVYGNNQETVEQREFFGNQQMAPDHQILFNGVQSRKSQEKVFSAQQQPTGEQQRFYSSGMQVGNQRGIHSAESHLKSQVYADKQLFSVQTQGLSAFDTRKQPLMLPRSSLHSSSMIVSGLNNVPLLPALVYNSSPVPSSHAMAIAKGAAVRQHLQTPYVRYVYSHLL